MTLARLLPILLLPLVLVPARSAAARPCDVAQHGWSLGCCDAPARWAERHASDDVRIAIDTEDKQVTLLLDERVVALQLSDRMLHRVDRKMHRDAAEGDDGGPLGSAIRVAVVSGVHALLSHSMECPVRELRDVRYEGGRLVLVTREGHRLFEDVSVDDSEVLGAFSERDARAFVREFHRALGSRR